MDSFFYHPLLLFFFKFVSNDCTDDYKKTKTTFKQVKNRVELTAATKKKKKVLTIE